MADLILIKLGGSVITNKNTPNSVNRQNITRLCQEIANAYKTVNKNTSFIICNGGGSVSHPLAAKYKLQNGFSDEKGLKGFSLTSNAEVKMSRIVMEGLIKVGLPVVSFAPASFLLSRNREVYKLFLDPIKEALRKKIVPVMYGDMVIDTELGCVAFSSEKILGLLAKELKSDFGQIKIINCTATDGVYSETGKVIPEITPQNFIQFKKFIHGSRGVDITGGMLHKVEESINLAGRYKIYTLVISGNKKDNLFRAILGQKVISTLIRN